MVQRRKQRYKVCRNCKFIVEYTKTKCPICGSSEFSDEYIGIVIVIDDKKSELANKIGLKEGMWAIRVL